MKLFNIYTNYDSITFLACNNIKDMLNKLNAIEIEANAIDYDPKFENSQWYQCKDFVFDDVNYYSELVVHMNCEKTYPLINHCGDVILIGDDEEHSGDCNPVYSTQQLINQYQLKEVYQEHVVEGQKNHYIVWGRI